VPYFVDLRTVPLDQSNLPLGPRTLTFRAYSNGGKKGVWSEELTKAVSDSIRAVKGGVDAKYVPATLQFFPVQGQANAVDVNVTVNLDTIGTWQVDLPTRCYDYAAMGMNGPEALGLEAPLPEPPDAQRPNVFGCEATTVMTTGSCPHVAYSFPVFAPKSQGAHVWKVVWSEPAPATVNDVAITGVKTAGSASPEPVSVAVTKVAPHAYDAVVTNLPGEAYGAEWKFTASNGVATKFLHTANFNCTPEAGSVPIAVADQSGETLLRFIGIPHRGTLAGYVDAKAQPKK